MKILFSGFRDKNHSSAGGYDKITKIPLEKKVLWLDKFPFGNKKNRLLHIPLFLLEMATNLIKFKYDIIHFFYGDVTKIHYIPFKIKKDQLSIITIHLDIDNPPRRFHKRYINLLKSFDGIIVLSSQQQNYLKEKYNIESFFIPHGFNQPIFNKIKVKDINGNYFDKNKINIVVIGENYRDYPLVERILNKLPKKDNLHFHFVGTPKKFKEIFKHYNNVHIYPRLSNDEYYSIIEDSDYNFLPVSFATANNTLLEAQYLNTPSILPNIDGILDYAATSPYNLYYSNEQELIEILSSLNKAKKGNELKNFAESNFNWNKIYEILTNYYSNLLNKKREKKEND